MMDVQIFTLEGCFHIHLLNVESFSALIEYHILRGGLASKIYDIATSSEANNGSVRNILVIFWCDVETWKSAVHI